MAFIMATAQPSLSAGVRAITHSHNRIGSKNLRVSGLALVQATTFVRLKCAACATCTRLYVLHGAMCWCACECELSIWKPGTETQPNDGVCVRIERGIAVLVVPLSPSWSSSSSSSPPSAWLLGRLVFFISVHSLEYRENDDDDDDGIGRASCCTIRTEDSKVVFLLILAEFFCSQCFLFVQLGVSLVTSV